MGGAKDPCSRSVFHRAQCAWRLGVLGSEGGDLADGVFESGEPVGHGPSFYNLIVCRLRHPREGDAEIQALCAALGTTALSSGKVKGLSLHLHLSDVPCVSCLGATLQFHFRHPGVLRVSFDRGRQMPEDKPMIPRPPPPPSKKGNPYPYAPVPEFWAAKPDSANKGEAATISTDNEATVDRNLVRRNGPDHRSVTSFYYSGRKQHRGDGAASGGLEAVPHLKKVNSHGGQSQTYYFATRPEFYVSNDYDLYDTGDKMNQ